jgi:hypothetical protein
MSLQAQSPVARVREPRSRAARRFTPRCQVPQCRARACAAVRIELPAAWEASGTYTVLAVVVGACREHAHELERRVAAMLEARVDYFSLLTIVDMSVSVEADLREQLAAGESGGRS